MIQHLIVEDNRPNNLTEIEDKNKENSKKTN